MNPGLVIIIVIIAIAVWVLGAKADAEAVLIEAKAQAEANEMLKKSLSKEIIQQAYLEKWDGKLPKVQSGDSMIYDIGKVE